MVKVSILSLAHNHEKYIRNALDGFVIQKTNFPFEVLIYDDASTDTTADIIQEYADKYPDIVKPLFEKENQFSRGENVSKKYNWPRVQGEYVAFCEGDDYWTDENKLQKQVDFLDSHPDCSLCFHPVRIVDQSNPAGEEIYPDQKLLQRAGELNFASLLKRNFIQTNSVVYRWRFHKESYNLMPEHILPGDWFLHLLHAQVGKIGFLPEVMAVYRRNAGGVWTGANKQPQWFCRCGVPHIKFFEEMEKSFKISKAYEREYFSYATCYAAQYLNDKEIRQCFANIKGPAKYKLLNSFALAVLKIMRKITLNDISRKYKARYDALKLYLSWKK